MPVITNYICFQNARIGCGCAARIGCVKRKSSFSTFNLHATVIRLTKRAAQPTDDIRNHLSYICFPKSFKMLKYFYEQSGLRYSNRHFRIVL